MPQSTTSAELALLGRLLRAALRAWPSQDALASALGLRSRAAISNWLARGVPVRTLRAVLVETLRSRPEVEALLVEELALSWLDARGRWVPAEAQVPQLHEWLELGPAGTGPTTVEHWTHESAEVTGAHGRLVEALLRGDSVDELDPLMAELTTELRELVLAARRGRRGEAP